ncbi:MAG: hypothetical protein ABJ233_02870 [Erythrobacter sp.]
MQARTRHTIIKPKLPVPTALNGTMIAATANIAMNAMAATMGEIGFCPGLAMRLVMQRLATAHTDPIRITDQAIILDEADEELATADTALAIVRTAFAIGRALASTGLTVQAVAFAHRVGDVAKTLI